jgi:hypothetical protein
MSDEQMTPEEPEVEGHGQIPVDDASLAQDEDEHDVDAHVVRANIRMD